MLQSGPPGVWSVEGAINYYKAHFFTICIAYTHTFYKERDYQMQALIVDQDSWFTTATIACYQGQAFQIRSGFLSPLLVGISCEWFLPGRIYVISSHAAWLKCAPPSSPSPFATVPERAMQP